MSVLIKATLFPEYLSTWPQIMILKQPKHLDTFIFSNFADF